MSIPLFSKAVFVTGRTFHLCYLFFFFCQLYLEVTFVFQIPELHCVYVFPSLALPGPPLRGGVDVCRFVHSYLGNSRDLQCYENNTCDFTVLAPK